MENSTESFKKETNYKYKICVCMCMYVCMYVLTEGAEDRTDVGSVKGKLALLMLEVNRTSDPTALPQKARSPLLASPIPPLCMAPCPAWSETCNCRIAATGKDGVRETSALL